jgi:hypothetical protein
MSACRVARRVALLTGSGTPRSGGVFQAALATKVLHDWCAPSRLGASLRTPLIAGVSTVATSVQRRAVGVRSYGRQGGACRLARCSGRRLTVLILMFWVTKGGRGGEAAE